MTEPAAELPISDARDHLADVVSRAHYSGRITYVTRRGQRLAAIVPAELARGIERAEDEADVAAADEVMARIAAGEPTVSWPAVKTELGL